MADESTRTEGQGPAERVAVRNLSETIARQHRWLDEVADALGAEDPNHPARLASAVARVVAQRDEARKQHTEAAAQFAAAMAPVWEAERKRAAEPIVCRNASDAPALPRPGKVEPWQVWETPNTVGPTLVVSVNGNAASVVSSTNALDGWSTKAADMNCRTFLGWFKPRGGPESTRFWRWNRDGDTWLPDGFPTPGDVAEWRRTWGKPAQPPQDAPAAQGGPPAGAMPTEPVAAAQGGVVSEMVQWAAERLGERVAKRVSEMERDLDAERKAHRTTKELLHAERDGRIEARDALADMRRAASAACAGTADALTKLEAERARADRVAAQHHVALAALLACAREAQPPPHAATVEGMACVVTSTIQVLRRENEALKAAVEDLRGECNAIAATVKQHAATGVWPAGKVDEWLEERSKLVEENRALQAEIEGLKAAAGEPALCSETRDVAGLGAVRCCCEKGHDGDHETPGGHHWKNLPTMVVPSRTDLPEHGGHGWYWRTHDTGETWVFDHFVGLRGAWVRTNAQEPTKDPTP